jgi:hypothetical protein
MCKVGRLRGCLLALGCFVLVLLPSRGWTQPGPIACCTEINLILPNEDVVPHGYFGMVGLRNPAQPGWNPQLRVIIPTNNVACPAAPFTIPLMSTMVASLSLDLVNREALVINANFFAWPPGTNPHDASCGQSIGFARSAGTNLSVPGQTVWNLLPDTLLLRADGTGQLVPTPHDMGDIPGPQNQIVAAVSGIVIVQDRRPVCYRIQDCARWDPFLRRERVPRTAIGLSADRTTLTIVAFEDGRGRPSEHFSTNGVEIDVLAEYFLVYHPDVTDVIMLDGSGSSTLVYHAPANMGTPAVATVPHDSYPLNANPPIRQYRPVPINLAFVTGPQENDIGAPNPVFGFTVPPGAAINMAAGVRQLFGAFAVSAASRLGFRVRGRSDGLAATADETTVTIGPDPSISVAPGGTFSILTGTDGRK